MSNHPQGYIPSSRVRLLRVVAKCIKNLFQIRGDTRWGNEFMQVLEPELSTYNPLKPGQKIRFRTGHGRLYWRSKITPYLEVETNEWIKHFGPNDVFYDIGANVGVYSLIASLTHGIRSYAFEMDMLNASILAQNTFLNNLQSEITILPIGLADIDSLRTVFLKTISPGDALHSIDEPSPSIDEKNLSSLVQSSFPCFSLDTIVSLLSLERPTHIKIDIDGQELLLLKGSIETLRLAKSIMIETGQASHDQVVMLLRECGFSLDKVHESHNADPLNRNCLFVNTMFPRDI